MIAQMDPDAASTVDAGDEGIIEVLVFDTDTDEAQHIADQVQDWLAGGVHPTEIGILVRQQPHLIAASLSQAFTARGIPFRNEQVSQDLAAEPAAVLVFNFIADERQASAYAELMRVAARSDASDEEALRFDRQLKRLLQDARAGLRASPEHGMDPAFWRDWVSKFLDLISRPVLVALSPGYQQGFRLTDVLDQALDSFEDGLSIDGDAAMAVKRLSGADAIRILTIPKCKGLEFEHVVVLGVEEELFWGAPVAAISEYFVAVSRAKTHLTLTWAGYRERPVGHTGRWAEYRTAHQKFLDFVTDD